MGKINKDNLGYLGNDFQYRLILQLISDRNFAINILEILSPNYFDDSILKTMAATIKDAYEKDGTVPDLGSLTSRMLERAVTEQDQGFVLSSIRKVEESTLNDTFYIQETAMKFCKTQELKRAVREIDRIIKRGDFEAYDECEEIIKKALELGNNDEFSIDVMHDIDGALSDDYRDPIPTGIYGLDEYMNGGLGKGELGVILAPLGVGKTTVLSKIVNTAVSMGYNVMQMYFEDIPKDIQRKHFACWSGVKLSEMTERSEEVKEAVLNVKDKIGQLKLVRIPGGWSMRNIRNYIRKNAAQGFKPDMVVLDYIDCVEAMDKHDKDYVAEGKTMREFENLAYEFQFRAWTAVQGNRNSLNSEIVETHQMGGSIKRAQIGHFILSIAKSLEQKENGTANVAILKSRIGGDGVVFENILFDNESMTIDVSETKNAISFFQKKEIKKEEGSARMRDVMNTIMGRRHSNIPVVDNQ